MALLKEKFLSKFILLNTRLVVGTYTAATLPFYTVLQRPWAVIRESKQRRTSVELSTDGSYRFWQRHGPPVTHPANYHLCDSFKEVMQMMRQKEDLSKPRLFHRKVYAEKIKLDANGKPIYRHHLLSMKRWLIHSFMAMHFLSQAYLSSKTAR